ncbi:hypothetical protein [Streptomyces sp. 900105245]
MEQMLHWLGLLIFPTKAPNAGIGAQMEPVKITATPVASAFADQCDFSAADIKVMLQRFVAANSDRIPAGTLPWPAPLQSLATQLWASADISEMRSAPWQGVFLAYAKHVGYGVEVVPNAEYCRTNSEAVWDHLRRNLGDIVKTEIDKWVNEAINIEEPIGFETSDIGEKVGGFADECTTVDAAIKRWIKKYGDPSKLMMDLTDAAGWRWPENLDSMGVILVKMRANHPDDPGVNASYPRFLPSVWRKAVEELLDYVANKKYE